MYDSLSRREEIQQIHREYGNFYRLLGGATLVFVGVLLGAMLFSGNSALIPDDYLTNLYTEGVSVVLTIAVLNTLAERRDRLRRREEIREQLLRDAGSTVNVTARTAIDEIRARQWLAGDDALLRNADLRGANLENVDLRHADLRGVDFQRSNLKGARLRYTQLDGSDFRRARMHSTNLIEVDLRGALLRLAQMPSIRLGSADLSGLDLSHCDLSNALMTNTRLNDTRLFEANLRGADLRNADLTGAFLQRAQMDDVICDLRTILPDGTGWSSETDWTAFDALIEGA